MFKSNGWSLAAIFGYFTILSYLEASIYATTNTFSDTDVGVTVGSTTNVVSFMLDNFEAFLRLIFFQSSLPPFLNAILVYVPATFVFWIFLTLIRGGAR